VRGLFVALVLIALPSIALAQQAETVEYYGSDAIGSIRIVYDASGTVIARQDYTPFGTPVLTGTSMPKEAFGGNEKDDETQEMYFHARILAARTGRFNRPDPIGGNLLNPQTWNRYDYALDNGLRFADPSGLNADPTDCTWIDPDPDANFPGAWSCGAHVSSGNDAGGGGFWSGLFGVLFGGGPGDPTDILLSMSGLFNGGSTAGAGASSSFSPPDIGGRVAVPGGVATSSQPNPGSNPTGPGIGLTAAAQLPTGTRSAQGDAQINAIALGVNSSAASLFTRPATYGVILLASAAGGIVIELGPAAAGATANRVTATAIALEAAKPGRTEFWTDLVSTWQSPVPSGPTSSGSLVGSVLYTGQCMLFGC
jgi:RHS repeat-associated protein